MGVTHHEAGAGNAAPEHEITDHRDLHRANDDVATQAVHHLAKHQPRLQNLHLGRRVEGLDPEDVADVAERADAGATLDLHQGVGLIDGRCQHAMHDTHQHEEASDENNQPLVIKKNAKEAT